MTMKNKNYLLFDSNDGRKGMFFPALNYWLADLTPYRNKGRRASNSY